MQTCRIYGIIPVFRKGIKMKKEYILAVLFFGGLWGISEAALGDALYRANVPYASVPLTIIGFVVLTLAGVYFPSKGTPTLIAALAMLYKFLNEPFFACHLLGIVLTGICYDLFFNVFRIRSRSLSAAAAAYLSYLSFAITITYVFRYEYWEQAGLLKLLSHVIIGGSIAAVGCVVFVPLSLRLGEKFKTKYGVPFKLRWELAAGGASLVSLALWVFGIAAYLLGV